jgi:hypothetical protein
VLWVRQSSGPSLSVPRHMLNWLVHRCKIIDDRGGGGGCDLGSCERALDRVTSVYDRIGNVSGNRQRLQGMTFLLMPLWVGCDSCVYHYYRRLAGSGKLLFSPPCICPVWNIKKVLIFMNRQCWFFVWRLINWARL